MESCKGKEFEDIKKVAYLSINNKEYADEIEINLGDDYEYKFEMNRLYILKKKPVYPKTYEECCKVLDIHPERGVDSTFISDITDYEDRLSNLMSDLYKLLICRDAYWKIAGEKNKGNVDYVICNVGEKIINTNIPNSAYNHILTFPTKEIRDAYKENFVNDIEICKEFL